MNSDRYRKTEKTPKNKQTNKQKNTQKDKNLFYIRIGRKCIPKTYIKTH